MTGFIRLIAAALLGIAATAAPSVAQTISNGTGVSDVGADWRSNGNLFGQDGYYVVGANARFDVPDYVASGGGTGFIYPGNFSYALINDPATTPGATPTNIFSGTWNPFSGVNQPFSTFTFTLAAAVPSSIKLGLMFDNLDIAAYNSSGVRVTGPNGSASGKFDLSGAAYNNLKPDWVFFDLAGLAAGQTFTVETYGGLNGCGCMGAVSFDSVAAAPVPEPSTWAMMIGGMGMVGGAIRTRRRREKTVLA